MNESEGYVVFFFDNALEGRPVSLELMVPQSMVKMIVTARSEGGFGFSPRVAPTLMAQLPPVAGTAPAPDAPPQAVPPSEPTTDSPANATTQSDWSKPPEG